MAKKMYRYGRKTLSLLLSLVMVTSLMQLSVLAAEVAPEAEPVVVDHVSKQGEVVTEGGVSIRKTARDLQNNQFEITLQVTIPKDVEVTNYDPVRVVMVIDSSSSMTNFGVQRLASAKTAAKTLAEALLTEEGVKAGNQVAVATYNRTGSTVSGFSNDLATLKSKIDNISTSQGTNIQAGLKEARDILAADSAFEGRQIVILLSDGEPTYSMMALGTADWTGCNHSDRKNNNNKSIENLQFTGFDYDTLSSSLNGTPASRITATCTNAECGKTTTIELTNDSRFMEDHGSAAIYEAGLLKATEEIVYSIFVGNDGNETSQGVMDSIASDAGKSITVSDEELASLAELFEGIATEVTAQVTTAGTVTDPMGDYVTIDEAADPSITVEDEKNLVWNVTDIEPVVGEDGSKTYTVSYTIDLNTKEAGFVSRHSYPANKTTTFTYWQDGEKYEIDFDIPEIWGENPAVDLSVIKEWDKNEKLVAQPSSAMVQLCKNGEPEGEPVELNDVNQWFCQWTDLDGDFTWTVEELDPPAEWEPVYTTEGSTVTITNVYQGEGETPPEEITVTKVWADVPERIEIPESITYTVNGQAFTMTADDAVEGNIWVDTIEVEKAEAYLIEETGVGEDWESSVDGLTITNTYTGPIPTDITVIKVWNNVLDGVTIPESITYTVNGEEFTMTAEDAVSEYEWNDTITVNEAETYQLVETNVGEEWESSVDGMTIMNTYDNVGSLQIVKHFAGDKKMPSDALFQLKDGDKTVATAEWDEDFSLQEDGSYVATITNIPVGTYTLVEVGATNATVELTHALTATVTVNGKETSEVVIEKGGEAAAEIVNTYTPVKEGTLVIRKDVVGASVPSDAAFTVTGPNDYKAEFTYNNFVDGVYTLTDLAPGTYTVSEDRASALVDGFQLTVDDTNASATITKNGKGEVSITNTYAAEVGDLIITKNIYGLGETAVMPETAEFQILLDNEVVRTVTWGEFENGTITVKGLPIGSYTINEVGAEVEGYSGPALLKIYDNDPENTAAEVTLGGTGAAEITNTYKKIETEFYYDVIHEFYTSTNGGEYILDGTGEAVQHGPVETAPTSAAVFNAEARTDSFGGATYARAKEYAEGEVIRTGELKAKTLTYTVKYYRTDWNEGSLIIYKDIKGLDQKTERSLKSDLVFRVTGPEGYDEIFNYNDHFNGKGVLTLENLEPGTYTIEEIGAEVGGGYDLYVEADDESDEDGYQVSVEAGADPAEFEIVNEYTSRVYNIWFDGGAHGKVQNSNYITVEGLWRSHWHNYQQDMEDPFGDDYDWASSLRTTGKTVYGYGSGTLYPDLNEDPEIVEDTNMVLYTITWAQWADHSRKMYIDEPALETEDGWTSNEEYYVVGTDIPFTGIADAIEYMNSEAEPDGNGFYNVHYRPLYENEPEEIPDNPYIPDWDDDDDDDDYEEPEVEIPEEEVPLAAEPEVEIPEEEVPLTDIPESDVPKTGDDMMLYAVLAAVSGIGLGCLLLTGKKREEESAE